MNSLTLFLRARSKSHRSFPTIPFFLHRHSLDFVPTRNIMFLQLEFHDLTHRKALKFVSSKMLRFAPVRSYVPSKVCWNCSKTVKTSTMFCESCKSIQPVNINEDFFQILGIKRSFAIEITDLRQRYRKLQSLLHPDKFSLKPKKEQELSEEYSSAVNKAFYTLLNPLERGLYLLSLYNIYIGEENTDIDKAFLMEIMERNEEMENESDPQKLKKLNASNKEKIDLLIGKVAVAFDSENMEAAKKLLTEMKYYNSIDVKIKDIKQKLNIPD